MRKLFLAALALIALAPFSFGGAAFGQVTATPSAATPSICYRTAVNKCTLVDATHGLPISGGGSGASSGGLGANPFTATSANNGIPLAVTSTTGRVALTSGVTLKICNTGAKTAYVTTGNGSVTATTAGIPIPAAACDYVASSAAADIAGIAAGSDTTSLVIIPGSTVADGAPTLGSTSGGLTPTLLNALSTTVKSIKSSAPGQLHVLVCNSADTVANYVQVFDVATAGAVTLGTTVPKLAIGIPPGSQGGYSISLVGAQFSNGIQVAGTTTPTGSSAPATAPNCNALSN